MSQNKTQIVMFSIRGVTTVYTGFDKTIDIKLFYDQYNVKSIGLCN